MATIETRQRAGQTIYRVKVRVRGHDPINATFDRRTDAKRWAAEVEADIRAGRWMQQAEARKHTLAELIDRYLVEYLPTARLRSEPQRRRELALWRERLGRLLLSDVTAARIVEVRAGLVTERGPRGKALGPASANRMAGSLRHCLNVAVNQFEWIDNNPMCKVPALKEPKGRARFLDRAERDRLLAECRAHGEPLHCIVVVALSTGARRGEILNLRWADVDLSHGKLTFQETKNGDTRSVALTGFALDVMRAHAKVRRLDTNLVFPGAGGKPLEIGKAYSDAVARAGIEDFRFHDLRHTAASMLAANGATLAEIAEVLGHKTLQMVKRYAHLTEGHTRGVIERMNREAFR